MDGSRGMRTALFGLRVNCNCLLPPLEVATSPPDSLRRKKILENDGVMSYSFTFIISYSLLDDPIIYLFI